MTFPLSGRAPLVIAALLYAGSIASAQGWEGGVKSGVSHAGLTARGEFDWKYALTSAVFAKRRIARGFSIQPELLYVRRSGVSSIPGSTLTMTADNVELPVMLNLYLPIGLGIAPYFSAGPSFALRLRCKLQFLGGGLITNDDCDGGSGGGGVRSRRVDLGVAGGAGIGWNVGQMTLVVETRASTGLRTYVLPSDVRDARSLSWSVLAGISVPLNPRRSAMPPVRVPLLATVPAVPARPVIAPARTSVRGPLVAGTTRRFTLTADDVDVRELIEGIAKATGFNVIVATQVHRRVSAALFDVTAEEAIQALADVAGLSVMSPIRPGQATIVVSSGAPPPTPKSRATRP